MFRANVMIETRISTLLCQPYVMIKFLRVSFAQIEGFVNFFGSSSCSFLQCMAVQQLYSYFGQPASGTDKNISMRLTHRLLHMPCESHFHPVGNDQTGLDSLPNYSQNDVKHLIGRSKKFCVLEVSDGMEAEAV